MRTRMLSATALLFTLAANPACQDDQDLSGRCDAYCELEVTCGRAQDYQTCLDGCAHDARVLKPQVFDGIMDCSEQAQCQEMTFCPEATRYCHTDYGDLVQALCDSSYYCGEITEADLPACFRSAEEDFALLSCYKPNLVRAVAKCIEEKLPCTEFELDECLRPLTD